MADPHTEARELSAGTVAARAWLETQVADMPWIAQQAFKRVTDDQIGQLVTVIRDAIDGVRDNPEATT